MDDWFSDLDNMDGDNSFTQCFVNSEEHQGLCCGTETLCWGASVNMGDHVPSKTGNLNMEPTVRQGAKRAKSSSDTRNHIMSERKRRQQIAERFIALSALLPGLKRIDKASILGEAINHVKQLEGRIAVLEQESKKKSNKSMISFEKSQHHPRSASCGANSNYLLGSNHVLPEVEVIGLELEKKLLIRILCEKRKGILLKLLASLGNTHLSIAGSSVLPFGKNTLNITIIAQMDEEYTMTGDELVKSLTQDLLMLYEL